MINHEKNINLQLTISKTDFNELENIRKQISELLNFELTKSQTITYLIKNFKSQTPNDQNEKKIITITKNKELSKKLMAYKKATKKTILQLAKEFNTSRQIIEHLLYEDREPKSEEIITAIIKATKDY